MIAIALSDSGQRAAVTLSLSLQCRPFSRIGMDEKSLSTLFPRWGAVVLKIS